MRFAALLLALAVPALAAQHPVPSGGQWLIEPGDQAARDPEFIASLDSAGYKNLGAEDLVRLRDHGVSGDYIADRKEPGYALSSPEELVEARDHGVDPSYIRSLREAGYENLSLQELRRAGDHGVTG